jgi:hypothetical protein
MALSVIRVAFSRQANDGDYGSETARCELEYTVSPDEDGEIALKELPGLLLIEAREFVHQELSKSPNWKVRRAVAAPEVESEPIPAFVDDDEDLPL